MNPETVTGCYALRVPEQPFLCRHKQEAAITWSACTCCEEASWWPAGCPACCVGSATWHIPGENQDCCFLSCSTGPGVSLQVLPPARRVVCPWYSKPELSMSVPGLQKQTPCLLLVFKNRLHVCSWSLSMLKKTKKTLFLKPELSTFLKPGLSKFVPGLQNQRCPCLFLVFKTRDVHVCSWSSKESCPCLFLVFKTRAVHGTITALQTVVNDTNY